MEKKIFRGLHQICFVQIVSGYYFSDNVGGATISTNIKSTSLITIRVQYLRIQLSSFREEDCLRFTPKFAMLKLSLAITLPIE